MFESAGKSTSGKTERWVVYSRTENNGVEVRGAPLGWVCWYARWRKYTFQPIEGTVFEQDCLRDIASFLIERTVEHKTKNDEI